MINSHQVELWSLNLMLDVYASTHFWQSPVGVCHAASTPGTLEVKFRLHVGPICIFLQPSSLFRNRSVDPNPKDNINKSSLCRSGHSYFLRPNQIIPFFWCLFYIPIAMFCVFVGCSIHTDLLILEHPQQNPKVWNVFVSQTFRRHLMTQVENNTNRVHECSQKNWDMGDMEHRPKNQKIDTCKWVFRMRCKLITLIEE